MAPGGNTEATTSRRCMYSNNKPANPGRSHGWQVLWTHICSFSRSIKFRRWRKRIMKHPRTLLSLLVAIAICAGTALAQGNGAPNGAHYNLNIIGVEKN